MKKFLTICLSLALLAGVVTFSGCGEKTTEENRRVEITVASSDIALWSAIRDDFNVAMDGKYVAELSVAANPESVLESNISNGLAPDVVLLPTGRGAGLTEELIRNRALKNLDSLLEKNVFGEEVSLSEKFLNGFLSTSLTNPYQMNLASETSTYMLPLFYDVHGLFYNKELMTENGGEGAYKLPDTWVQYLNLRPSVTAANEGVAESDRLYMYGYGSTQDNESIIAPTIASYTGNILVERMLNYDYIYDNADFAAALGTFGEINSLLSTGETESGLGNYVLGTNAAQALLNKKLMFLAGSADTYKDFKAEGVTGYDISKLGFTASFSANDSSRRYAKTEMEQIFIPLQADNVAGAEAFLLYLFSNRAADKMLENKKVIPTKYALENAGSKIDAEQMLIYNVFSDDTIYPCNSDEALVDASQLGEVGVNWDSCFADGFTTYALLGRNTPVWTDNLKANCVILRSALLGNK